MFATTRIIVIAFSSIFLSAMVASACIQDKKVVHFGIDYGKLTPAELDGYDLVVIEQDQYSDDELRKLSETGTTILGYFSTTEVHPSRPYFSELEKRGLLGRNPNWGGYYVNLKDSTTREVMLDSVLPRIMDNGLDGLLLDTVDGVAPYTNRSDMQEALLEMFSQIREQYPAVCLIQNGGLFLLPESSRYVDGVMLESIATLYDFREQQYRLRPEDQYRQRVALVKQYGKLVQDNVLLVDYINSPAMAGRVKQRLDTLQYPYYLSRIQLDSLRLYATEP